MYQRTKRTTQTTFLLPARFEQEGGAAVQGTSGVSADGPMTA